MPRQGQHATSTGPRPSGRLRWRGLLLPASALLAVACAQLSPQTSDLRPQYGFTARAASAPLGFYGQVCDTGQKSGEPLDDQCPKFYGMLPAAVDDADAARLRVLSAEINDSGAPWLVTAAAYPVGAYALYRGLFGQGEEVRREVARLGLVGSAAYGWLKSRESQPRQQIRLAAVDALSCAMYGSVARYLYERKDILGGTGKPASAAASSASAPAAQPAASAGGAAARDGESPVQAASEPGLVPSRRALRDGIRELNRRLVELRVALASTPASFQRAGAHHNGCDARGAVSTTCQSRGQGGAPMVSDANPEVAGAELLKAEAEKALKSANLSLSQAQGLLDRINNAPHQLLHTVRTIEAAANRAVQATEADVDALRRAIGGMKLGSQDLSGVLSAAAAPPPATGTAGTEGKVNAQSGTFKGSGAGARASATLSEAETRARTEANRQLVAARLGVSQALDELLAAEGQVQAYLEVDRQRAASLQGREDCQFLPPGLKLVVDPQDAVITVAPGGTQRFVAQGGTQMPTVALVGNGAVRTSDLLRTEPDATAGRQSLTAVISPAASVPEQDLQLVFRNGDLVQYRTVSVRKPVGGGK